MSHQRKGLISASAEIMRSHKRYVAWFYLLNLLFAWWGAGAFAATAHNLLDHSLHAGRILHGMDMIVVGEFFARPETGPMQGPGASATFFAAAFFLASLLFMPGVLLGYASDHRISRDEFFRACGRNLWRFVRVFVMYAIIGGIIAGILFGIHMALVKMAEQNANDDRIPFFTRLGTLLIIFLAMTVIRAWFDLAQTDVVLRDENAARKSVAAGFRIARRNLGRLTASYLLIAIIGFVILSVGIELWHVIVPPASVFGAFLVSQLILLLLLAVRFWQRAAAVACYLKDAAEQELKNEAPVWASAV
jgi:hypothetical protein